MATYTPNHNLGKPDSSDQFSAFRQLFNDNMDKIDQISGGGGGGSGKILKNQTLVFNNNVATISDADIKADSDFAVYYYDEAAALAAGIVSSSSLGVITFTAQTTPLTTIIVDVVIFSASGGGGSSTFAGLSDVDFTNLQNGQIPKYNSTTQKWENANESGGGGDTVNVYGTFIDTNNIIQSSTAFQSTMSYTATEDCYITFYLVGNNNSSAQILIDNNWIASNYYDGTYGNGIGFYLKNGQTISVSGTASNIDSAYMVYGIQQGSNVIGLGDCYSTSEREVGCWTDGKPLYQKTLTIEHFNIDTPLGQRYYGYFNIAQYINNVDLMWVDSDMSHIIITSVERQDIDGEYQSGDMVIYSATSRSDVELVLTVLYTKTTDTAGGGSWTPDGTPTVHYDGNEKIIGTWFGETLYEKTVSFTLASSHATSYTHGIANIDKIVDYKGIFNRGDDTYIHLDFARWDTNEQDLIGCQINKTTISVFVNSSDYYGQTVYVTIQYTKT